MRWLHSDNQIAILFQDETVVVVVVVARVVLASFQDACSIEMNQKNSCQDEKVVLVGKLLVMTFHCRV